MTVFFFVFWTAFVGSACFAAAKLLDRRTLLAKIQEAYQAGYWQRDRDRFLALVRNQPDRHHHS